MTRRSDDSTKLKILVIGQSSTGKSSLLARYVHNRFDDVKSTVGASYDTKTVMIGGQTVKLDIWDTAGTERFNSVNIQFYRDAQGALLVYDVSDRASFIKLESWYNELINNPTKKGMVIMTVGNKTDKGKRKVTREEGLQFARRRNTLFTETSAKTNDGVQLAFENLVQKIIQTPSLWKKVYAPETPRKQETYVLNNRNNKNTERFEIGRKCCW